MYKTHGRNIVSTMGSSFSDKNIYYGILGLCGCIVMVFFPEVTVKAGKDGIALWLNNLVPALLPFFIIAGFVKRTGIVEKLPVDIYPFAMAVLSGYPMGASVAADYYREGYIDCFRLKKILSYSMVTGPVFIIGTVGGGFIGDTKAGYILAASHYGAALLNGVLYNRNTGLRNVIRRPSKQGAQQNNAVDILTDSILDSFRSVGIILAYIMIFLIVTELFETWGFFSMIHVDEWEPVAKGLLEMTIGCSMLGDGQHSMLFKIILISFLISFGGLSVTGQSLSMLKGCPVTFFSLLQMKATHGVLSGILSFIIGSFVV